MWEPFIPKDKNGKQIKHGMIIKNRDGARLKVYTLNNQLRVCDETAVHTSNSLNCSLNLFLINNPVEIVE